MAQTFKALAPRFYRAVRIRTLADSFISTFLLKLYQYPLLLRFLVIIWVHRDGHNKK